MILWVSAPHFTAGAIFQKKDGKWECIHSAPIIHWMVGKEPNKIKKYLISKKWTFQWIKENP